MLRNHVFKNPSTKARKSGDAVGIDVSMVLNRGAAFPQRLIYGQDELNSNVNAPDPVPTVFDVMEVFR